MHAIDHSIRRAVRRALRFDLSPCSHGICKLLEHLDCAVPIHAGVCNTHTFLQGSQPTPIGSWSLLVALVDVALDHDANDAVLAVAQLVADDLSHFRLVLVVLLRVACTN